MLNIGNMNQYFCVLPFFSLETGFESSQNIYCCRLQSGTAIENVQNSIRNKQRSSSCSTCWKLEDSGLVSERQIHNRSFDFYADRDLELVEKDALEHGWSPKIIKLHTSNICNGTCVTCGPVCSSAWAKLEQRPIKYKVMDASHIDWAGVVQLSFVGGEPFLEKQNFDILEKLSSQNNTSCFISIVTNGSIKLNPSQLNTLSKFKNLNLCLSIDGIGRKFDYIRWPLKWEQLLENLEQYKKIARHISVSCMISNLNIYWFDEIIDFFTTNNLNYICKQIESPHCFASGNLPEDFKKMVIENNPNHANEVKTFLSYQFSSMEKFWEEIDRQDKLKGISIQDYLPELFSIRT
jgi:hypothetical protein